MVVPLASRAIDAHHSVELASGWSMLRAMPGEFTQPAELPGQGWREVRLPTTVGAVVGSELSDGQRLDSFDWWFRCELPGPQDGSHGAVRLRFEGLATLAEAWADGRCVLRS
ncbi:MAG: hypothetical protein KGJ64_11150, partial [Betaproteobacteria bacterium]|nr:hypothetical protein [Betaproteobacteria bacterium]